MIPETKYTGKGGLYVGAYVDEESVNLIRKLCEEVGLPLQITPDLPLHVTVIYSEKKAVKPHLCFLYEKPLQAFIVGLDLLGEDKNTLVMKLESERLNDRHEFWKKLGAEHSWPDYKPHVTLCYGVDKDKWEPKLKELSKKVKNSKVEIFFKGEYNEDISDKGV